MPASVRRLGWILGGLLSYLLFLLAQMPVDWLIARLPANSQLKLQQASGAPWNGAIDRVVWQIDSNRLELGRLTWQWLPSELLHGRIGLDFELGPATSRLKGRLVLGRNEYVLKNIRGDIDAAVLGFVSRPMQLLQPQGSLTIDIPDLNLSAKRIFGQAAMNWQNARSGLIAAPLGNYRMTLNAAPDGRLGRIAMHTLQGALVIEGGGEYALQKGLEGKLQLKPPQDERRAQFSPVLDLIGQPDANGVWTLILTPR